MTPIKTLRPLPATLDQAGGAEARTLRSADELVAAGLLLPEHREDIAHVAERYATAITPAMAELIDGNDPNDPIARQFVPDVRELVSLPQELTDPIGDEAHSPLPGIVHRYRDRVLLKITHVCPVYCRFCFRREMVGPENGGALSADQFAAALDYIRAHPEIWEVILTGGDPFILSTRRIAEATRALGRIAHLKILRWHTRVPVVDPARLSDDLIAALKASRKTVVVAIHANHPREFTPAARGAIAKLADAGIVLLSQTVLLKGVNDSADTLEGLMRVLLENRIRPYYLHHGDLAPGTSHLRTSIEHGRALMRELARRVSGAALPRYVLDIPGGHGKVDIESHLTALGNATYTILDPNGAEHVYADPIAS